jgi:hypothetical protein
MHLMGKDNQGTLIYILAMGLVWAIVVVPAALIGQLFKARKVYSPKMRMIRGGVLTAVGLFAFVLTVASQRPPAPEPPECVHLPDRPSAIICRDGRNFIDPKIPTGRGFQPWIGR